MENSLEIKALLKKYNFTYNDILEFLDNFSHIQRISEELSKPITLKRKEEYLIAIKKAREKKKKELEELF